MTNFNTLTNIHLTLGAISFFVCTLPVITSPDWLFRGSFLDAERIFILVVAIFFPLLHFFIAYGCKTKKEGGRIASRIVGFLLLPFAPVGTIFGLTILDNSKKVSVDEKD